MYRYLLLFLVMMSFVALGAREERGGFNRPGEGREAGESWSHPYGQGGGGHAGSYSRGYERGQQSEEYQQPTQIEVEPQTQPYPYTYPPPPPGSEGWQQTPQ